MLPVAGIWLARCCGQLEAIEQASLFLDDARMPAACWPDPDDPASELEELAAAAFAARRVVTRPRAKLDDGTLPPGRRLAIPIELGSRRLAVVALVFTLDLDEQGSRRVEGVLAQAGPWLGVLLSSPDAKGGARNALLMKLVTTLLEPEDATGAYVALSSELATALACDRVSLGLLDGRVVRLAAVSHSARFDARTRLGRSIAAAMEESIDAESVVRWPGEAERAPFRAHAVLCESQEMGCAFSVPLSHHGEAIGAITAEYRQRHPAGPVIASRLEQLATLLGPLVALRQDQALSVPRRVRKSLGESWSEWKSADRRRHRALLWATVLLVLGLGLIPGTHRIGSPARLEGLVQRAIVAPIDGYVAESRARAGDVIKQGAVLGAIDDTDLQLERRKWIARTGQLNKEYRAALASRDRSEARILGARVEQARAELDLVEQQLARTLLVAPFDGVVAEGDLSRKLGSPVERGEVLFQVAPLDRYRIVLEVDETEIDEVERGQNGRLKLTAQPGDDLLMVVERVVPIAVSEDGRNFFRVEAGLLMPADALRPGMEGVGKIEVGRRSLLWIYTHSAMDWIRFGLWSWLP